MKSARLNVTIINYQWDFFQRIL